MLSYIYRLVGGSQTSILISYILSIFSFLSFGTSLYQKCLNTFLNQHCICLC